MKKFIVLFSSICFAFGSLCQGGKIEVLVVDSELKEPMFDVKLFLTSIENYVLTDIDGTHNFTNLKAGLYTLKAQYPTMADFEVKDIKVSEGSTSIINIVLKEESTEISGVTVTATINRGGDVNAANEQKSNDAQVDVVSEKSIKSSSASNAGDAVKMVSGASIQENKFAIIRGLNDRYNTSFLNGSILPSTESDRKAFAFDLIPASALEAVVISKTATPDQASEFAGGNIYLRTKGIPDTNFISMSMGTSYNSITTFQNRVSYTGSSTDWLGIDNGRRNFGENVLSKEQYPTNIHDQAALAKYNPKVFDEIQGGFNPNFNSNFTFGYRSKKKQNRYADFGFLGSISYKRSYELNKTVRKGYTNNEGMQSQIDYEFIDSNNISNTTTGALLNLGLNLGENTKITLKNSFNINSSDRFIRRSGELNPLEINPNLLRSNARWFNSNQILTSQLEGITDRKGHRISRINWLTSFNNVSRSTPELSRNIYTRAKFINDPTDPIASDTLWTANIANESVGPNFGGGFFSSQTNELSINNKIDFTIRLDSIGLFGSQLKIGAFNQIRNRDFSARQLGYTKYNVVGGDVTFDQNLLYLDEENIFKSENMGLIAPGVGGFKLTDGTKFSDAYNASSNLNAAYIQINNEYRKLRLIYGLRGEYFKQILNAKKDNNQDLKINSSKFDLLPSINAIYDISNPESKKKVQSNVRLSYSQTINRPEYRELAPFAFYDFTTNLVVSGNDTLQRAKIHNADARFETYFGRGQMFTFTTFYKYFINPIEQKSRADVTGELTFQNAPSAQNFGIEIEYRAKFSSFLNLDSASIGNNFSFFANAAFIKSTVDVSTIIGSEFTSRPLQGQSPFLINASLRYGGDGTNTSWYAALNVNRAGRRIAIVGNINDPDIWENGRTFIDFQIGKTFLNSNLDVKLVIQNVLAENQIFYQNSRLFKNTTKFDADLDDQIWKTNVGRIIGFSISYRM